MVSISDLINLVISTTTLASEVLGFLGVNLLLFCAATVSLGTLPSTTYLYMLHTYFT